MADSGITLQDLRVSHPGAGELDAAYRAIGLENVTLATGPVQLCARLLTPRGIVEINS
jgi:hypothetical protein